MAKKERNINPWYILFGIIILVLLFFIFGREYISFLPNGSSESHINVEIDNPNPNILSLENQNCFWLGNQVRCSGRVKNIASGDTQDDIFLLLLVNDENNLCESSCKGETNLGVVKKGEIITYSVTCDISKRKDVVAKLILSGTNAIFNICS